MPEVDMFNLCTQPRSRGGSGWQDGRRVVPQPWQHLEMVGAEPRLIQSS